MHMNGKRKGTWKNDQGCAALDDSSLPVGVLVEGANQLKDRLK